MNAKQISPSNNEYFCKYIYDILKTDSQDIVKNNKSKGNEEHIVKYKYVVCNIDYRNALN